MGIKKRLYLCGCTVITRTIGGKRRFSIFPACEDENCFTRKAVKTNELFNSNRKSNSNVVPFPFRQTSVPLQNLKRNRRRLSAMQATETSLDSDFETRLEQDL